MRKKIRVETPSDLLYLENNTIYVVAESKEYAFGLSTVERILLLTTDMGPFYDDMGLAIEVGDSDVIFIMSEHKCYQTFLFEQIGKVLPVDFQKIIEASVCTENNVFEIYVKCW